MGCPHLLDGYLLPQVHRSEWMRSLWKSGSAGSSQERGCLRVETKASRQWHGGAEERDLVSSESQPVCGNGGREAPGSRLKAYGRCGSAEAAG